MHNRRVWREFFCTTRRDNTSGMTVFCVHHQTVYTYRKLVRFGDHYVTFRPRDSFDQRLVSDTISVDPGPADIRWTSDAFGNCITVVTPKGSSDQLAISTRIVVDHSPENHPELQIAKQARTYPFKYDEVELPDLEPTISAANIEGVDEIARWAKQFTGAGKIETGHLLMTMCYAIRESFTYQRRNERGTQPPIFTLHQRRGSCRDFAAVMIAAARTLGFAARFVSGYIYVASRDSEHIQGGGATHAWCQIYLPGSGWVEFDPTNGIVGNRNLIRVAVAREPRQAVPLWGTYRGRAADFVSMDVQVRVTKQKPAEAAA